MIATHECSYTVHLKRPHAKQELFLRSNAPRKIIRAGRRGGKTTGLAIYAVEEFLKGERVLYAVPTAEQILRFWHEVSAALEEPIEAGLFKKNQTLHIIEREGTEQRIRAKTAWNADTLRGDYCTRLILDEWQLCNEDAWELVGSPMLMDKSHSTATFCYTPPSIRTTGTSKARDPRHAAKMFAEAEQDITGRWAAFHFPSHDNPHISKQGLADIAKDMSHLAYTQEILAMDGLDVPGALWTHAVLDQTRVVSSAVPELIRIAIAMDPSATSQATADEMGLIAGGLGRNGHGYTLQDASMRGTPAACARRAIQLYDALQADVIVAEVNNGGEWIGTVIQFVAQEMYRQGERATQSVNYKMVHASRGKQTRAEPIATEFEHNRVHHVGVFSELEEEECSWVPGMASPNRMDAEVWLWTELLLGYQMPQDLDLTALTMRQAPIHSTRASEHSTAPWQRILDRDADDDL